MSSLERLVEIIEGWQNALLQVRLDPDGVGSRRLQYVNGIGFGLFKGISSEDEKSMLTLNRDIYTPPYTPGVWLIRKLYLPYRLVRFKAACKVRVLIVLQSDSRQISRWPALR